MLRHLSRAFRWKTSASDDVMCRAEAGRALAGQEM